LGHNDRIVSSTLLNIFNASSEYAKIMKIINLDNIEPKTISNIIFDWGGVITNIDNQATIKAFTELGHNYFDEFFTQSDHEALFGKLEKGLIDPAEFYTEIRGVIGRNLSDNVIKKAWCEMLLDTPVERIEILKRLREKYSTYLLSNTNRIHAEFYNAYLGKTYNINYRTLFKKAYYSYEMGMRKPDSDIFDSVLKHENLDPQRTLFIDDTEANIAAASTFGIIALHLTKENTIEKIFKKWVE
jgi:glucose-1-phosphatase